MNAGAYGGETKDVLLEVVWLDENGSLHTSCAAQLELSYRHSRFSKHGGIVLEAVYALIPGRQEAILAQMEELMRRRRESSRWMPIVQAPHLNGHREIMLLL